MTLPSDDKSLNNRLLQYVQSRYAEARPSDGGSSVTVSDDLRAIFGNPGGTLTASYGSRAKQEFAFEVGNFDSEHEAVLEALRYLENQRASREGQFPAPPQATSWCPHPTHRPVPGVLRGRRCCAGTR